MLRIALLSGLLAVSSYSAVIGHEVIERTDVLDRRPFGSAGPYERMLIKYKFAVDPANPANRIISDIDYAPKNAKGLVEFSADVFVLKPTDPAKGNGTVLVEVPNRGRKGLLSMFQFAEGSTDPRTAEEFGDFFLMEQGYTLISIGWEWDVPRQDNLLRLYAPAARDAGQAIRGIVRSEFTPERSVRSFSLGDRNHIAYPVADPADPKNTLTVRDSVDGPRTVIPRDRWQFARDENGQPAADSSQVFMKSGFEAGRVYEVVYTAEDPILVGLGPAAIRDVISMLKYNPPGTNIQPLGDMAARKQAKRVIGFGVSQCGRFLRTFLYYGFNRDEANRQVFDGMMVHVAGAGRGSFNHRFAQASRDGHPYMNNLYPSDIYPFTDLNQPDPETGMDLGLLDRAKATNTVPKIFYTNTSYEYWGRAASLIHTTLDGKADMPLPDTTRVYLFSGAQHGPGNFPPKKSVTRYRPNTNDYRYALRALLGAMNTWVAEGKEPPPSQYPRIDMGTLVPLEKLKFPALPGVEVPQRPKGAWRTDFGPDFYSKGIVTQDPPKLGSRFPVLLPQVDGDGNEIAGIRLPEVAVPLATLTGWNLRAPELGAPHEIYSMVGSWFAFPKAGPETGGHGDPRTPIGARYTGRDDYLSKVRQAGEKLAARGYVQEADIPRMLERARAEWDYLTTNPSSSGGQ